MRERTRAGEMRIHIHFQIGLTVQWSTRLSPTGHSERA